MLWSRHGPKTRPPDKHDATLPQDIASRSGAMDARASAQPNKRRLSPGAGAEKPNIYARRRGSKENAAQPRRRPVRAGCGLMVGDIGTRGHLLNFVATSCGHDMTGK